MVLEIDLTESSLSTSSHHQADLVDALRERGYDDKEIATLSPEKRFDEYCDWEGLIHWGATLRKMIAAASDITKANPRDAAELKRALVERGFEDHEIEIMGPEDLFAEYCEWNGLIGWSYKLLQIWGAANSDLRRFLETDVFESFTLFGKSLMEDVSDISYETEVKKGVVTKVVARLRSVESGRYTKLGRNLQRIEELNEEIKKIKDEVKSETKELIADLFEAEHATATRVVETVGFVFKLTKDPEPTTTYKYSEILTELQKSLTPELIAVLESLKDKYKTVTQKSAALSLMDKDIKKKSSKVEESAMLAESWFDKLRELFSRFKDKIMSWGRKYDSRLDALKAKAGLLD